MHSQTYIWQMCNKWLLFNFDVLGAVIIFCITLMALQGSSAGSAGIAIVSVQSFVGCLFYISRDWTNVEQAFNSVERVEAYLSIPHESAAIEEHRRPPAGWPSNHGDVLLKVEDLSVRYAPELPDVLKGISFEVKPRERVGIVGRTGSGKSTLGMSLLRFCDPSGGHIVLDEIDITTIGVEDLRSRMVRWLWHS
jgi:ABC-type multidrug transport system fused ATPase/permease subunit